MSEKRVPFYIKKLVNLYKNGDFKEALVLGDQILKKRKNSFVVCNVLGATNIRLGNLKVAIENFKDAIKIRPDYPDAHYNLGIAFKEYGEQKLAVSCFRRAIELKTNYVEAYHNLAKVFKEIGEKDLAISAFKQAIKFNPEYAEAYNDLGLTLKELGRTKDAIECFHEAINKKKHFLDFYNNLGITYREIGDTRSALAIYKKALLIDSENVIIHNNLGNALFAKGDKEAAVKHYKKAVAISPSYWNAYNNLGVVYKDLGKLDASMKSYVKAINLNNKGREAKSNLIELLTSYKPKKKSINPIIELDNELKKLKEKYSNCRKISDKLVIELLDEASVIKDRYSLSLGTELSQVYRRNIFDLDCSRHKGVFNNFSVVPQFCFSCFKVEIDVASFLELFKLFVIFDGLVLKKNNTRKCLIELRDNVPGFYKGLIYCDSVEEADSISKKLILEIEKKIGKELPIRIKRGCSEYGLAFPEYKEIDKSSPRFMKYNTNWKKIERDYDKKRDIKARKNMFSTVNGLSLSDFLIIRLWYDYSRGIGDMSGEPLKDKSFISHDIFHKAKKRINKFPFTAISL